MRPLFAGGHAIGLASIYLNRRLDRDLNAGTREHVVDFPMAAVQDTDSGQHHFASLRLPGRTRQIASTRGGLHRCHIHESEVDRLGLSRGTLLCGKPNETAGR